MTPPRAMIAFNLLVRELPAVRDQRPAVVVARPHRPPEQLEALPEALVAEVRHVEDDVQPLHLAEQRPAVLSNPAAGVGPLRVDTRPVVRRPDGAQPLRVRPLQVVRREDGIRALEAQYVSDRRMRVTAGSLDRVPVFEVTLQRGRIGDVRHLAGFFHGVVPRELALRLGPGLLLGMPAGDRAPPLHMARDHRRHAHPHAPAPHLAERDGPVSAIGPVRHAPLGLPDLGNGPSQVAVPLERVHREVQVRVEDEWLCHAVLRC